MTLKLLMVLNTLYYKIKQLTQEGSGMGWKTMTGSILTALGVAAKALIAISPLLDPIGAALIAIGIALGGVGVRAAIAKSK